MPAKKPAPKRGKASPKRSYRPYRWVLRPRKCLVCGAEFAAKGRQSCCGPICAATRAEGQRREWERKRANKPAPACLTCGKPLAHGNARYCPLPADCRIVK